MPARREWYLVNLSTKVGMKIYRLAWLEAIRKCPWGDSLCVARLWLKHAKRLLKPR